MRNSKFVWPAAVLATLMLAKAPVILGQATVAYIDSTMSVARNQDGRLEVFGIGSNFGAVYHNWQQTASTDNWYGWQTLGSPNGGPIASPVVAASNVDGRLEIFVLNRQGSLCHIFQLTPNGNWGGWEYLGGGNLEKVFRVEKGYQGRLEVFAIGADNVPYHLWQKRAGSSDWSGWSSLGGAFAHISSVRNRDGRLEVFALDGSGTSHYNYELVSGGNWAGWHELGGEFSTPLTPLVNEDGRVELFGVGSNGLTPYHCWQLTAGSERFSSWQSLGASLTSSMAGARNSDGRLEIFGLGLASGAPPGSEYFGQQPLHNYQVAPNGDWSGWVYLNQGTFTPSTLSVGQNQDGRLEVFTLGTDPGSAEYTSEDGAGDNSNFWKSWNQLGGGINYYIVCGGTLQTEGCIP